jgi:hypothetical protein
MAFPKRDKSFIVWAPPWSPSSAGIVVLHRLAQELSRRGEKVYMTTDQQNPEWPPIPTSGQGYAKLSLASSIVIYPEIVHGNPLGCENVARLILHIPGYWGGPVEFDKHEVLWAFLEFWNRRSGLNLPNGRILTVPYLDLDLFRDYGNERIRDYFYRGKGEQPDVYLDAESLGGKEEHNSQFGQVQLVEKLNTARILYSYDNVTAMNDIARLCGCPVVLIPDPMYKREDIELLMGPGMGYGLEEEALAKETMDSKRVKQIFIDREGIFQDQLTNFIEIMKGG